MKKVICVTGKILLFFIGWAVLAGMIDVPCKDPAVWRFGAEGIPLVVILILSTIFIWGEKGQVIIPISNRLWKGFLTGVGIGILWIGSSLLILYLTKQLWIIERTNVTHIWLWMLSAFLNVIMQEFLVRGYIYQMLKVKYNLLVALIVTTIMFTLMHGGAFEAGFLPVVNVITMCLFTSALYESEKTLVAPIMAHSIWNIVGAIIFNAVSLADDYPNLFVMKASDNTLLSGGMYKIEGSIVVFILNCILMVLFWLLAQKRAFEIQAAKNK